VGQFEKKLKNLKRPSDATKEEPSVLKESDNASLKSEKKKSSIPGMPQERLEKLLDVKIAKTIQYYNSLYEEMLKTAARRNPNLKKGSMSYVLNSMIADYLVNPDKYDHIDNNNFMNILKR